MNSLVAQGTRARIRMQDITDVDIWTIQSRIIIVPRSEMPRAIPNQVSLVNRYARLLVLTLALSACGSTEPENILLFRGTVIAAVDGAGYTAGQVVEDAQMTLRYTAPLDLTTAVRDTDITDAAGSWELESGPPPGQRDPNCDPLIIAVVRVGFETEQMRLASLCGQGAGTFENIEIGLTPATPAN